MTDPLNAGAICTRVVTVVEPSTPLPEAARLMRANHVGCVVAIDRAEAGNRPIGILTDRDIVVSTLALDLDARALCVEDIMTRDLVGVDQDEAFTTAISAMRERGVRRILVTGPDGVLVGLLAFDDMLAGLALQLNAMTEAVVGGRMREGDARP
jgi:CBS domain-containing protein